MSEKFNMRKRDHETSSEKMKHITGSHKNYEHPSDKAERLCRGGFAKGGSVLDPGGPTHNKNDAFYSRDGMKINLSKGDE